MELMPRGSEGNEYNHVRQVLIRSSAFKNFALDIENRFGMGRSCETQEYTFAQS